MDIPSWRVMREGSESSHCCDRSFKINECIRRQCGVPKTEKIKEYMSKGKLIFLVSHRSFVGVQNGLESTIV